MMRQSSSAGPWKYLHNYDKKFILIFCKRKKRKKYFEHKYIKHPYLQLWK